MSINFRIQAIIFVAMAYNRDNYLKRINSIIGVYNEYKESDIPDTRIVAKHFPKHGIFISYRSWMYIKNMKKTVIAQPTLFD